MRKTVGLLVMIILLLPTMAWAAGPSQKLDVLDYQILNGSQDVTVSGKQVIITPSSDGVKYTALFRVKNSGKETKMTVGLPESFKQVSKGFNSDIKVNQERLIVNGKLIKSKKETKTKTIAGNEVKGTWLTWEIPLKPKSVAEIRVLYVLQKISFDSTFQLSYLSSADMKYAPNAPNSRVTISISPYTPAAVSNAGPEGYKLKNDSVFWDLDPKKNDDIRCSIDVNNTFTSVYKDYFSGQDKSQLDSISQMLNSNNYKDASTKLELFMKDRKFDSRQAELLSFYRAQMDSYLRKFGQVVTDLKGVNVDNLQIDQEQQVFTGRYYYFLGEAYQGTQKYDQLLALTEKGSQADISSVMKDWLSVTNKRTRNVQDILAGRAPNNKVYEDTGAKSNPKAWVALTVGIIVALAGVGFWLYTNKKPGLNKKSKYKIK